MKPETAKHTAGLAPFDRWMVQSNMETIVRERVPVAPHLAHLRAQGYLKVAAAVEARCNELSPAYNGLLEALRRIERTDLSTVGPEWLGNFCRAAIARATGGAE